MKASEILTKMASDRAPVSSTVERWAHPSQNVLPIDDLQLAEASSESFDKQAHKIPTMDKIACARNIDAALREHGSRNRRGMATKLASGELSPFFDAFMGMRKIAVANTCDDRIDELRADARRAASQANDELRIMSLDKVAEKIDGFDREVGIDWMWDERFPNPAYTVYGATLSMSDKLAKASVKVASGEITAEDLDGADWSSLDGKIEDAVINGLKDSDDRLGIFESLPAPHREIIAQQIRG